MFGSIRKHARAAGALAVVAALAVGGVAVAQGGSDGGGSGKKGQRSGKRMPPPPPGPLGGPMARNLTYAELHVQRKGEAEVHRLDRGKIVSVDDSSIVLRENDGNEVTIAVDDSTRVVAGPGRKTDLSDLKTGQKVLVAGPEGGAAKAVIVPPKRGQMRHGPRGSQRHGQLPPPPGGQLGGPQGGPQGS
jgi:hypothetical protein